MSLTRRFAIARRRLSRAVSRNEPIDADQRAVWDGVDRALFALGAASPTHALSDAYDSRSNAIDTYFAAFNPQPEQIGVIYHINGVLVGLDLFGSEAAFARAFPKLLRGSALQALAGFDKDGLAGANDCQFLHAVLNATADRFPAVGLGEELRFDTEELGGGALEMEGGLVHLFAFPRPYKDGRNEGRAAL